MSTEFYEIRQLLNLYYGGLTTPDDEKKLISLLQREEHLPDDIASDRDIVMALAAGHAADVPDGMTDSIMRLVERLELEERRNVAGRHLIALAGVAASLAIVVSVIMFLVKSSSPNPHEITDPQTAFNETERALLMVSESLNKTGAFINETNDGVSQVTFIDGDSLYDDEEDYLFEDSLNEEIPDENI